MIHWGSSERGRREVAQEIWMQSKYSTFPLGLLASSELLESLQAGEKGKDERQELLLFSLRGFVFPVNMTQLYTFYFPAE